MESLAAVGFLVGLTVILGIVLALAYAKLSVPEDPRLDAVADMLPGNNCGACGEPGCRAFGEKVVAGQILPSRCSPGGPATAQRIADYLGIEAGEAVKRVARLLCAGDANVTVQLAEYKGFPSCRAATAAGGGAKGCRFGCLGFGDCAKACDFDAIKMSAGGLPIVDFDKCTACGDCVRICPKELFEIMPAEQHLVVQCKSALSNDDVLIACKVGCTACGKCIADAPQGLLQMKNNLPVVNKDLLHMQSEQATLRCPTGAIRWVDEQQFAEPDAAKAGVDWMRVS